MKNKSAKTKTKSVQYTVQHAARQPASQPQTRPAQAPRAAVAVSPQLSVPALPAWLPWAVLALLVFLAYLPALGAGFIWDDDALTDNLLLRSVGGLLKIWTQPTLIHREQHYWPLVYSSFWLEYQLFGLSPLTYHLSNILLHAAATLLLWRVLRSLAVPGAWFAAALFAVHPVHAESVAWIIERKDVLSGALFFASILAFLSWDRGRPRPQSPTVSLSASASPESSTATGNHSFYILSLALFAAALLSKSIVIGLPIVLGIALWWRNGRLSRRDLLSLSPFALLALVLAVADLTCVRLVQAQATEPAEGCGLALSGRVLLAGRAFWVYLANLAWPHPLAAFYPTWPIDPGNLLAWLPLLGVAALLGGLWAARGRLGRGPLAAVLFFGVMLGPVLGLVDFEFLRLSWVADRFQYLASAGPLTLAAAGLVVLAGRLRLSAAAFRGAAVALLLVLQVLCFRQAAVYHDSIRLFGASVAAYPQLWPAQYHYGWALLDQGRSAEAIPPLREAMRLAPKANYLVTHDLATALGHEGNVEEANALYQQTIQLAPKFASGYHNYGAFLAGLGQWADAVAQYREALRLRPEYPETLNNMGNSLKRLGKLDEAEKSLAEAVRLAPDNAQFRSNLAGVLVSENKVQEALAVCQEAARLSPELPTVQDNLGLILLALNKPAEAAEHFAAALKKQPQSAYYNFHLGDALQKMGQVRGALQCYQKTLAAEPNFPGVHERITLLGSIRTLGNGATPAATRTLPGAPGPLGDAPAAGQKLDLNRQGPSVFK